MAKTTLKSRLPWENRWEEPTVEQLLEPLAAHHRRAVDTIIKAIAEYDDVEMATIWYGPSWNWTLQFHFPASKGKEPLVLCYVVAKVGAPVVSIPLTDGQIEQLPMRRLNKLIREGIKTAKCAVTVHWANYTPNNQTEVSHLLDLIKRKHKLIASGE